MKPLRTITLLLTLGVVAACVPRQAPPPPVAAPPPRPVVVPRPTPTPPPPPPPVPNLAWTDAPLSPGNWTYRPSAQGSAATYGSALPSFTVRCMGGGQVILSRAGAGAGARGALTFRTSSIARSVSAVVQPDGTTATLSANDPLLDALIFSRGRFSVEAPGAAPLIVPTWPELARVVQDCRR